MDDTVFSGISLQVYLLLHDDKTKFTHVSLALFAPVPTLTLTV